MKTILKAIRNKGYEVNAILDNKHITHIYATYKSLSFCFIHFEDAPYILRINPTLTLDRWGVCDIQKQYDSAGDLISALFDLEWVYEELTNIYVELYRDETLEDWER